MDMESITAWFSYAQEQHPLVSNVCKQLQAPAVESVVKSAIEEITKSSESEVSHVRLVPYCYRLDSDETGMPIYRLAPGDSIDELTFDIANNPLRIIVLSDSYFKSQHCLEELCLSLCFKHALSEKLPLLILHGFKDNTKVLLRGEFDFSDLSPSGKTKKQTLLQALESTHKSLRAKIVNRRGFDLSTDFCNHLPKILDTYATQLHISAGQNNIEENGNVNQIYASAAHPDPEYIAIAIYRYSFSYLSNCDLKCHNSMVEQLYRDWCEKEFSIQLLEKLNESHKGNLEDRFIAIRTIDDANDYFFRVFTLLSNTPSLLKIEKSEQIVYQLYGLVILKTINPIGASLLSAIGYSGSLINVNVEKDQDVDFQNSIHATLSFCSSTGLVPKIDSFDQGVDVDDHKMTGVIFPRKQTISGVSNNELLNCLKEVGSHFALYDSPPSGDRLLNKDDEGQKKYIECIRDGIKDIRSVGYALIALSFSLHRGNNGYFPLIEQVEELINYNYPNEKLSIPCVILRADSSAIDGIKTDMLFSHEAFRKFRRQFQHISNLYSKLPIA
jgi:hypothetical protein